MLQEPIISNESLLNLSPSEQEGESPMENAESELQQELAKALAQLRQVEEEKQNILDQIKRSQKKKKIMLQLSAAVLLLYAAFRFHREMGQVGWNWLQATAGIFGGSPEQLCGMALFLAIMYLLWKLLLCVLQAAAEDFMEEGNDNDLADR